MAMIILSFWEETYTGLDKLEGFFLCWRFYVGEDELDLVYGKFWVIG